MARLRNTWALCRNLLSTPARKRLHTIAKLDSVRRGSASSGNETRVLWVSAHSHPLLLAVGSRSLTTHSLRSRVKALLPPWSASCSLVLGGLIRKWNSLRIPCPSTTLPTRSYGN